MPFVFEKNLSRENRTKFSQMLLQIMTSDERVTPLLGEDGMTFPEDAMDALLDEKINAECKANIPNGVEALKLKNMLFGSKKLIDTLKKIAYPENNKNILEQDADWSKLQDYFNELPQAHGLSTVRNFVNKYGPEMLADPMVKFSMGIAQSLSNACDLVKEQIDMAHKTQLKADEKKFDEKYGEILTMESEFAKGCTKYDVQPDNLDDTIRQVQEEIGAEEEVYKQQQKELDNLNDSIKGVTIQQAEKDYKDAVILRQTQERIVSTFKKMVLNEKEMSKVRDICHHAYRTADAASNANKFDKEYRKHFPSDDKDLKCSFEEAKLREKEGDLAEVRRQIDNLTTDANENQKPLADYVNSKNKAANLDKYLKAMIGAMGSSGRFIDILSPNLSKIREEQKKENPDIEGLKIESQRMKRINIFLQAKEGLLHELEGYPEERKAMEEMLENIYAVVPKGDEAHSAKAYFADFKNPEKNPALKMVSSLTEKKNALEANAGENGIRQYLDLKEKEKQAEKIVQEHEREKMSVDHLKKMRDNYSKSSKTHYDIMCDTIKMAFTKQGQYIPENAFELNNAENIASKILKQQKLNVQEVNDNLRKLKNPEQKAYEKQMKDRFDAFKGTSPQAEALLKTQTKLEKLHDKERALSELVSKKKDTLSQIEAADLEKSNVELKHKAAHLEEKTAGYLETLKQLKQSLGERRWNDSKYFKKMSEDLDKAITTFEKKPCADKAARQKAIDELGKSTKTYIEKKNEQYRPNPSAQRMTRLESAQCLDKFCESTGRLLQVSVEITPESYKQVTAKQTAMEKFNADVAQMTAPKKQATNALH